MLPGAEVFSQPHPRKDQLASYLLAVLRPQGGSTVAFSGGLYQNAIVWTGSVGGSKHQCVLNVAVARSVRRGSEEGVYFL